MKERSWSERRADWAEEAVEAFAAVTRLAEAGETRRTQVLDLLTNLRHLCDRWGLNFERLNAEAQDHYEGEVLEEGPRCRRARPRKR